MFDPLRRSDPDYFEFDWAPMIVAEWVSGLAYGTANVVRPLRSMGFYAECMTAGESAMDEPRWVALDGATVRDGSVIWTMRAPSSVSLSTISIVTYAVQPDGIIQSLPSISGLRSRVKLDASSASLGTYSLVAEMTAAGEDYSIEATLEVID